MSDNNERESARSDNPDNGGKNTNRESKSNERGNTEHEAKKSNRLAKLKENIVSSKMGIPKVLRRIKSTASTLPGKKKKKIGDDTDLEINRNQRPDTTDEASIDGGGVAIPGSSNGKNDRNKRQSEKERVEDLRTKYSPNLRAVSTVNRGETEDQDETHSNKSEGSPQITEYDRQVILKFDMNEFNKVQDPPGLNALFKKKSENEKKGRRIPANINAYEIQSYTESDLKKDEQNTSDTAEKKSWAYILTKTLGISFNTNIKEIVEYTEMDGKKGIKVALGSFLIHFFATSMLAAAAVSISITNVVEWEKDKNFGMNRSQLNQIILNYGIMMMSCGVTGVLGIPGYLGHLTSYTITIMLGGLLMALTLFLPSMSSGMAESGVVMIIQAIVLGIGISLNYIPAYTILAQWYHKRLGLMTGISLSGCALGTLVFSIINNSVIRNYGHVKAMQIQGIIIIVGCLMSSLLIKMHILKSKKAGFFDWKIISDTRFLVLASATLISGLGRYMFSWLTSTLLFMINIQHGGGNGVATCIVLVVSQLLGFIGGGYLSDRTGYIGFIGVSMFVFAISVLLLLAIIIPSSSLTPGMPEVISPTTWPIYIVLVLAGISNGTLGSVIPASILQMFGPVRLPSVTGLLVLTINILVFIPTVNYTIFNDSEAGGYNYINKEGFVILTILAFLATVIGGVFALCLPKLNRRYKRKLLMRELEQQHHEIRRESVVILSSEKEVEEEKKIETIIR